MCGHLTLMYVTRIFFKNVKPFALRNNPRDMGNFENIQWSVTKTRRIQDHTRSNSGWWNKSTKRCAMWGNKATTLTYSKNKWNTHSAPLLYLLPHVSRNITFLYIGFPANWVIFKPRPESYYRIHHILRGVVNIKLF